MNEDIKTLAPQFELEDLEGNIHRLSDYKGKKVYIEFWASWCSVCLSGLGHFNQLAGEENEFVVLSIVSPNFSGEMNSEDFKEWFASIGMDNITVLLDEGGEIAYGQYGVRAYPTSAYINSNGELEMLVPGPNENGLIKKRFVEME